MVILSKDTVEKAERAMTSLDEVELYLGILKIDSPEKLYQKTYKQITDTLNKTFNLNTNEADVFLLYEPTIEELEEDLRTQFSAMGLCY